jgi:2-succinyl-6-hydroxy-2,4-cyclohexadiene-1-carboxylate synthase
MIPKHFFPLANLSIQGIKPNRLYLKSFASTTFIRSIFSHEFINNKSNRTVVFLHGFLGNKNDFIKISHQLNLNLNFLIIDLPGHGDTLLKNFYSQFDFFNKLKDLIFAYTDTPILYGYSMGGRIALELALNYFSPQILILESAGLGLNEENQKATRLKVDSELFSNVTKQNLRNFLYDWYKQDIFFQYNKSEHFEFDIEKKLHHSIEEWKNSLLLFSPAHFPLLDDNLNKLNKTSFPLHYIYGNRDSKYANTSHIISKFNPARFKTYPIDNCGHNPHKTHENQIVNILTNILKN